MRRNLLVIVALVVMVLVVPLACEAPAEFKVVSLDVTPSEVTPGERATITADVRNTGGSEGTYTAMLTADGSEEGKEDVTVAAGATVTVTFSLVKDILGSYQIAVGELSSTLIVKEPAMFEVSSLDVTPPEAAAGEVVNVTAQVTNSSYTDGTYTAILTVHGVGVERKDIAVAAGASEVVTFELAEDTPGTYQIGLGGLTSTLVVIEEVELKYDDGTSDGSWAIGGKGRGHVVHFSPAVAPFTINQVKIYGSLYGAQYEKLLAQIEVWDEDFNILYSCLEPHTNFSPEPGWVGIAVPDIIIDGDFYIFVCTSSPKEGGVQIHYDSSGINMHSEVTEARKIADWYLEIPKDEINWMIRVEGSQATTPSSAEEEPAVKEIELKYDDGVGTGGSSGHSTQGGIPGGYSVHFSPPTVPFTIVEVKVFARVSGTGYQPDKPSVEIWDKDFNVLYSCKMPATEFSPELDWVTIDIPNITADGDFRVVLFTNPPSPKRSGVTISYDVSGNKGSEVAKPGGKITEWFQHWELRGHMLEARVNWMIRVVGLCSGDVIPVSPPPPERTVTMVEFQENISSLDTPEKLSEWMIDNIEYESHYETWKETGVNYRASPEEILESKVGCCAEFAIFACSVLEHHGYEAEILTIAVESDPSKGHGLCVCHSSGSLYTISVGRIEGPYQTYEDIAFDHHKDWSKYSIYYSWGVYQKLGYPGEVVYRE